MSIVERPSSWYEPDEPSSDEVWVDSRVEEMLTELQDEMPNEWIGDYVDWDKVQTRLEDMAIQELEEMKSEQAIAEWEARQEYLVDQGY